MQSNKIAVAIIEPNLNNCKETNVLNSGSSQSKPSLLVSWRFCITLMLFLGASVAYIQRIDMGLAIVCMVNNTALIGSSNHSTLIPKTLNASKNHESFSCIYQTSRKAKNNNKDGAFVWNKNIQGWILSSYFYGYILTQVPSGWLSLRFGGKLVLGMAMFIGSIMTILAAPIANLGYAWLIFCRFTTGLAHEKKFTFKFIEWAPPLEKSRMIGLVAAGINLGNVFALGTGGYLCANGFANGWPSIFYIFGIIGIAWLFLFMILVTDSPFTHRFISHREKSYIMRTIKSSRNIKSLSTPWKSILTSKACYAAFIAHFSVNWGNYLPYLAAFAMVVISGQLSDFMIGLNSNKFSTKFVRKLFTAVGLFVPTLTVLSLTFITCAEPYVGVVLLVVGIGFFGCATGAGYQVNINEISGPYAAVVYGISNTFSTIPGIVAPYLVSILTKNQLQSEWRVVFFISALIFVAGGLFYSIFGQSKPEKWTEVDE